MQPHVHKVSRDVVGHRPLAGRLGYHQCNIVFPQHVHERRIEEALVPDFNRMAHRALCVDIQLRSAFHPVVVIPCDGRGLFSIVRQQLEKRLKSLRLEREVGRELPEDRPQLLLQVENAGRQEVGQRRLDVLQALHVRDEARPLD